MKEIKLVSILLLACSIIISGIYYMNKKLNTDTVAPVFSCESNSITLSVHATEEELLQGITAKDDKSGDVTDSIVIEKISGFVEEGNRVLTYAAIDASGNVARMERMLTYTDYEKPVFALKNPMRFPVGTKVDLFSRIEAHSVLDGDLTHNIKYSLDKAIDLSAPGTYNVEFRVADSAGNVSYLPVEVEIYSSKEERGSIVLSDYLIYLSKDEEFLPKDYYVESSIDGRLTIHSTVDSKTPGVYTVDYTVTAENGIAKSRLIVVVK